MKTRVMKAKHHQGWTSQTSLHGEQARPGGKGRRLPQEYSILEDKYARVYVYKLLNKKGPGTKYLKDQIRQIEDKHFQKVQRETQAVMVQSQASHQTSQSQAPLGNVIRNGRLVQREASTGSPDNPTYEAEH